MEKTRFVDQKAGARFERVRSYLLAHPVLFATQGTVVATWRAYGGRRLGPYFRVSYRDRGRQRSMYLGRCGELAGRVRGLLARIQRRHRQRRLFTRLKAQVRASLRRWKARLGEELAAWGIRLKGFEFRGASQALWRYVEARHAAAQRSLRRTAARTGGWSHTDGSTQSGGSRSSLGVGPPERLADPRRARRRAPGRTSPQPAKGSKTSLNPSTS